MDFQILNNFINRDGHNKRIVMLFVFSILALSVFLNLIPLNSVRAAGDQTQKYTLLAPLPEINSNSTSIGTVSQVTITQYLQYAYNLVVALASVAAVFMITWGGFLYMTSEAIPAKQDGLKKVRHAIYGLLLILCSWLILRTINPNLVDIPPTFVPQISLSNNVSNSTITDLFGQLNSDAQQYQANSTADWQARNAAQAQVTLLQNQANEDYSAYNDAVDEYGADSPQAQQLKAAVTNDQNQIQTQQSTAALTTSESIFNQSLNAGLTNLQENNNVNPSATLDTLQASLSAVNTINAKYAPTLSPSDQQTMKSEYAFTDGTLLDLQTYASVPITAGDDATINAAITKIQNTTSAADATLANSSAPNASQEKTTLDSRSQQEIADLKSRQAAVQEGTLNAYFPTTGGL